MGFLDTWNQRALQRREGKVEFAGEQAGLVEDTLKRELILEFATRPAIRRAYFAQVRFQPDETPTTALCIVSSQTENGALVTRLGEIFRRRFANDIPLDIVFLSAEQELELKRSRSPFYSTSVPG
jgi:hypothetical protein